EQIALAQLSRRHRLEPGIATRCAQLLRSHVALDRAQRGRLRLASALGHRLGKVRKQHGEPQPQTDGEYESRRRFPFAAERLDVQDRSQDAADIHHEHHGIAPLILRSSLTTESTSACWKIVLVTSERGKTGSGGTAGVLTWVLIRGS